MANLNKLSIISLCISLTNCSSNITGKWSCGTAESKFGCVDVQDIEKVYLDKKEEDKSQNSKSQIKSASKTVAPHTIHRSTERVAKIWIAPYVDSAGIYHEARMIRVVEKSPEWQAKDEIN